MNTTKIYLGFRLVTEQSGNVSIYTASGRFVDKLANMSEAKDRVKNVYSK